MVLALFPFFIPTVKKSSVLLWGCPFCVSMLDSQSPAPTRLHPHCKKNLPGFLFYRFPSRFHLTRRARMHGVPPVNLDASSIPSEPGAGRRGRNRHAENEETP